MIIKLDQKKLLEIDACRDGIIDFSKTFPEGVELDTTKTYVFEEHHGYIEWLFARLKINFKTPISEFIVKDNLVHYKHSNKCEYWKTYDENGNEIHYKNSYDYEYWKEYDENNNGFHYKSSTGYEEWKTYDENGNEIHYKDSDGFEYWNKYDKNNNEIHHKHSDGFEYWKKYDEKCNEIHYKTSDGYEYSGEILKLDHKTI